MLKTRLTQAAAMTSPGLPLGIALPTVGRLCDYDYVFLDRPSVYSGGAFTSAVLDVAQGCGAKVILKLYTNTAAITAAAGGLDLTKLDAEITPFIGNIDSYITGGTVVALMCVDEPHDTSGGAWGGVQPDIEDVDAAAALHKSYWPGARTIVGTLAPYVGSYVFTDLDELTFMYANHKDSTFGSVYGFVEDNAALVTDGQIGRASWIIKMEGGGTPNGTDMTPERVKTVGLAMLRTGVGSEIIISKYNGTLLADPKMLAAIAAITR